MSSRANVLLLAASLALVTACAGGQTYTFDDSGSYTGDAVLTMVAAPEPADAGGSEGRVTPLPAATLAFDGAAALTLWPGCSVSVTRTGTESTQDQRDTTIKKANGSDFQVTDTYDQVHDYAVASAQGCDLGPVVGERQAYTLGSGSLRFTVAGHVSGNVGGTTSSGAMFVYTFDGDRDAGG